VTFLSYLLRRVAGVRLAGGDPTVIADKQARYDAAVAARDSITAVLDYRKQPSFEVGTMGFWMATGQHPCGDDYPLRLPTTYHPEGYPTMPPSWPSSFQELMTECVAFDPRDRPDIAEVAARLREMRAAAWMTAGDDLDEVSQVCGLHVVIMYRQEPLLYA
jgi:hypothetical protein